MLSTARPPRAGAWGRKGDNGAGEAELPPQAVLLCCSAPSVSCQALAWLRPPAAFPAGLETPPQAACRGGGAAALGEPHAVKGSRSAGMLREGVSNKRGWPFGCCKGVQTACNEPRPLLGTDISLFFLFKQRLRHAAKCAAGRVDANPGGKPQKEKAPPTSLPVTSPQELRRQRFSHHWSPLCHA